MMKRIFGYLLSAIFGAVATENVKPIGDLYQYAAEYFAMRHDTVVEDSIESANGNWRIDDDGTVRAKRIILTPCTIDELGEEDGTLIFLEATLQLGFYYDGSWRYNRLIPEEEWVPGMITDVAFYWKGKRYIPETADLMIQ